MSKRKIIFSVQLSPEGGYEARALAHSIFTQADSVEELKTNIRDATACHFDTLPKDFAILKRWKRGRR